MATEVEIKFSPNEQQLVMLRSFLAEHADFVGAVDHEEYYVDRSDDRGFSFVNGDGYKDAYKYLRVRFSGDRASICLKDWIADEDASKGSSHVVHSHCNEYETTVADGRAMLDLFVALGYDKSVIIRKHRKKYIYQDIEIVVDEVVALGCFVEVEAIGDYHDVAAATARIMDFLRGLGFISIVVQQRGYVSMLWNPDVDFGEELVL